MEDKKEIKVLILTSGLQLLGEVVYSSETESHTIYKPLKQHLVAIPQQTPQGINMALSSTLVPAFALTGLSTFEVKDKDLLVPATVAPKALQNQWIQMTSGIEVAQTSSLFKG